MADELTVQIDAQGLKIRELKVPENTCNLCPLPPLSLFLTFHLPQAAKASKELLQPEIDALLALKLQFKTLTGSDFGAPPAAAVAKPEGDEKAMGKVKQAPTAENAAKKAAKKEARRGGGGGGPGAEAEGNDTAHPAPSAVATASAPAQQQPQQKQQPQPAAPANGVTFYPAPSSDANLKCFLVAAAAGVSLATGDKAAAGAPTVCGRPTRAVSVDICLCL